MKNLLQATTRRISQAIAAATGQQSNNTGAYGSSEKSLKELEKEWAAEMKNFDALIEYAENIGDYESLFSHYASAQSRTNEIADYYRSRGYSDDSTEVLDWLNKGFDYSSASEKTYEELFGGLTDSLKDLISALDASSALQEKSLALQEAQYDLQSAQKAVTRAGEGLENAKTQRNIRVWNEETDSWDYVADAAAVSSAQEVLEKRQEELRKAENSLFKAENTLSKARLSYQLEAFSATKGEMLGSNLAEVIASALKDYSPGGTISRDTNYYFQNGITIGSDRAETMTLAELAKLLGNLEVY